MLEEALNSFLLQDYPKDKCELVIVNDCPWQTLEYEHPQVRIYNLKTIYSVLGDKENFAIEQCKGPLIAVWDDDDIALPNHLMNIAQYFNENTNLLHWANAVYYNEPGITALTQVGNSGIVFTKRVWEDIGGSPRMNAGGDMVFTETIKAFAPQKVVWAKPPDEEISWFYMWGGRGYHQSGMGTDVEGRESIVQRHIKHIESLRRIKQVPEGKIKLMPRWDKNYKKMLTEFIKSK